MENRIIVIIPFYNVSKYVRQCYDTLVEQEYKNYKLVFADDCSSDGSIDLIPEGENIVKVRQKRRVYALANIYQAIVQLSLNDDDIVIIIDGDDFLLHNRVFHKINAFYNRQHCLLSYGQYCTQNGVIGHCAEYTKSEFAQLRSLAWKASHLKTFKIALYRTFLELDPHLSAYKDEKGSFYSMTYDVALMHPLMEIAGYENVYFSREVLYVYRLHPGNDMQTNKALQTRFEKHIQSKKPFSRAF